MTDILRNKKSAYIMFIFPVIYLFITFAGIEEFKGDGSAFVLMHSIMVPITDNSINRGRGKGKMELLRVVDGCQASEHLNIL